MVDESRVVEFARLFRTALAGMDHRKLDGVLRRVRKTLDQVGGFDAAALSVCVAIAAVGDVVHRTEIEGEGDCRAEVLNALVEIVRDNVQAMEDLPRRWPSFAKDARNYKALFQHFGRELPRGAVDRAIGAAIEASAEVQLPPDRSAERQIALVCDMAATLLAGHVAAFDRPLIDRPAENDPFAMAVEAHLADLFRAKVCERTRRRLAQELGPCANPEGSA